MSEKYSSVYYISELTIQTMIDISWPIMVTAMLVGLIISLIQALTQIQEMTLSFVPKLLAIFFVLIFMIPYIGNSMVAYMDELSYFMTNGL